MILSRHAAPILAAALAVAGLVTVVPTEAWTQQKRDKTKRQTQNGESGKGSTSGETESESDGAEVKRSRTIRFKKYDARLERPVGWVRTQPGAGAALTLRAAGDEQAQIEVRVSSPVPQDRRESFFAAFHSKIEEAGFSQTSLRKQATYNGHSGKWTEYEGGSERGTFRLVVWQYYRDQTGWFFVGFFPKAAGDRFIGDLESLLESLTFE